MEPSQHAALAALSSRRFQSFAEAAEAALDGLAKAIAGTVVLGQFDPDGETCRLTDLAGEPISGLDRGSALRLSSPGEDWLDTELLRTAGIESSLTVALEMSDGNVVGLLCALAAPAGAYGRDELLLLGVAARMLEYEWEGVRTRAEVRQLRDRVRDDGTTDSDTGLANRDSFIEALDREWRLAQRSSVQSVVVACEIEVRSAGNGVAAPVATLGLKDVADVLDGSARTTDHAGRVATTTLAAALVGCDGPEGAEAFITRLRRAIDRVTVGRPFTIEAHCAFCDLEHAESATDALDRAETAARAAATPTLRPPEVGQQARA